MPSVQVTVASPFTEVDIGAPTFRVVATVMSAASETWITTDGSDPTAPVNNTINSASQRTLAGVVGQSITLYPVAPGTGGFSTLPKIRLASAGAPVIELEW